MPARKHFQNELEDLKNVVLRMAAMAESSFRKSLRALIERNSALADEVIRDDAVINRLECEIDRTVLKLIGLEQPMAGDLRFLMGCSRMALNIERVGDQAVNLAERALYLNTRPPLPFMDMLAAMADQAANMFEDAVRAFVDHDPALAKRVRQTDADLDERNFMVIRKIIEYMINETPAIERGVHNILAARYVERVGDLATNLAEIVIFIVEGEDVKHLCPHAE